MLFRALLEAQQADFLNGSKYSNGLHAGFCLSVRYCPFRELNLDTLLSIVHQDYLFQSVLCLKLMNKWKRFLIFREQS